VATLGLREYGAWGRRAGRGGLAPCWGPPVAFYIPLPARIPSCHPPPCHPPVGQAVGRPPQPAPCPFFSLAARRHGEADGQTSRRGGRYLPTLLWWEAGHGALCLLGTGGRGGAARRAGVGAGRAPQLAQCLPRSLLIPTCPPCYCRGCPCLLSASLSSHLPAVPPPPPTYHHLAWLALLTPCPPWCVGASPTCLLHDCPSRLCMGLLPAFCLPWVPPFHTACLHHPPGYLLLTLFCLPYLHTPHLLPCRRRILAPLWWAGVTVLAGDVATFIPPNHCAM